MNYGEWLDLPTTDDRSLFQNPAFVKALFNRADDSEKKGNEMTAELYCKKIVDKIGCLGHRDNPGFKKAFEIAINVLEGTHHDDDPPGEGSPSTEVDYVRAAFKAYSELVNGLSEYKFGCWWYDADVSSAYHYLMAQASKMPKEHYASLLRENEKGKI